MMSETVPVFDDEQSFGRFSDLSGAGEHTVAENVFPDPRVRTGFRTIASDCMEKKAALVFQTAMHRLHEASVILISYMLEHSDRNNFVVVAIN